MDIDFDLDTVCELLMRYKFNNIILEFIDEYLPYSVTIYKVIRNILNNNGYNSLNLYISADSTFGSSVDDVSALHVNGDVIVHFGSDLSGSGSIPVMIIPKRKAIDIENCCNSIVSLLLDVGNGILSIDKSNTIVVIYEPCYSHLIDLIKENIIKLINSNQVDNITVDMALLPSCADLKNWEPSTLSTLTTETLNSNNQVLVGGLIISEKLVSSNDDNDIGNNNNKTVFCYIGDKNEQLSAIYMRLGDRNIISYSPNSMSISIKKGHELREFNERYGGVSKVKDAKIIGIIIGSMGLTEDLTRSIIDRLKKLIHAAKKSYYVLVMGRLNEAKLHNFPQVDVYCLVANDDTSVIKPKTFHVPVITPWELELGLGAREWNSTYHTNASAILDGDIDTAISNVVSSLPEDPIDHDNDDDNDNDNDLSIVKKSDDRITVFQNAALDHFKSLQYHGLVPEIPDNHDTTIVDGKYGIASGYDDDKR